MTKKSQKTFGITVKSLSKYHLVCFPNLTNKSEINILENRQLRLIPLSCLLYQTGYRNSNDPSVEFDLSPTNNKTCKIVKRMEALGSPFPLDQISIIYFKRCSICRFVLEICEEVLRRKSIPKSWQRAATFLIYKKGDKSDPSNFRPITLEPVVVKIFTLLIRDRVFEFLHRINIQKLLYRKGPHQV